MKTLIQVKSVKKRYPGKEALKGVSLDIFEGEILGLLGVNGAGKTTLSTILAGLHPTTDSPDRFHARFCLGRHSTPSKEAGLCII